MYQPWPWGTQCETTEKGGNQWVSTKAVVGQLFSQGGSGRHVKQCLALGRSSKTSKVKVTTQLSKSSDSKFLPRLRKQHSLNHPVCGTSLAHQTHPPTTPPHCGLPAAPRLACLAHMLVLPSLPLHLKKLLMVPMASPKFTT